jgi:hypothetical protein
MEVKLHSFLTSAFGLGVASFTLRPPYPDERAPVTHHAGGWGNSTALLPLLHCKLRAVFTHLGSAVRVATLYDFAVTLKHAIW